MKKVLGVFILGLLAIGCGDMANQKILTDIRFENIDGLELQGLGKKLEAINLVKGKLTLTTQELILSGGNDLKQYRFPILEKTVASYTPENLLQLSGSPRKIYLLSRDTGQPVDLELSVSVVIVGETPQVKSVSECIIYDFVHGSDTPVKKAGTQEVLVESKILDISVSGIFRNLNDIRGNFNTLKPNRIELVNKIPLTRCIESPSGYQPATL